MCPVQSYTWISNCLVQPCTILCQYTIFIIYVLLIYYQCFCLTLTGPSGQPISTCINKLVQYQSLFQTDVQSQGFGQSFWSGRLSIRVRVKYWEIDQDQDCYISAQFNHIPGLVSVQFNHIPGLLYLSSSIIYLDYYICPVQSYTWISICPVQSYTWISICLVQPCTWISISVQFNPVYGLVYLSSSIVNQDQYLSSSIIYLDQYLSSSILYLDQYLLVQN